MNKFFDRIKPEPFKIYSVSPLKITSKKEREENIKGINYNVFKIKSEDVFIDFLTDSGTAAMSNAQWSAMMVADEAYGGAKSWYNLESTLNDVFGYKHVLPAHQGRGAEKILFTVMIKPGQYVPNNMHFSPDRVRNSGGIMENLICEEGEKLQSNFPFKGNMDIDKLKNLIKKVGPSNISFIEITLTCNNNGGKPVSMNNLKEIRAVASENNLKVILDAARIAENAYFIKTRETGYENKTIKEIIKEICSYSDGCVTSSKKDGIANMGGFVGINDDDLYEQMQCICLMWEGNITYGGMSGRDMEALAVGYQEVCDFNYLKYRTEQAKYLGDQMQKEGIPIVTPVGGHGVWIDSKNFASHIPPEQYPGIAITTALYIEGGIRACELGNLAFSKRDDETGEIISLPEVDVVRLAIPRRAYTFRHLEYAAAVAGEVFRNRKKLRGFKVKKYPTIKYRTLFLGELSPIEE